MRFHRLHYNTNIDTEYSEYVAGYTNTNMHLYAGCLRHAADTMPDFQLRALPLHATRFRRCHTLRLLLRYA